MNRTLLFGEGLFETIRWRGETEKVRLHYLRLKSSAEFFSIPYPDYEDFLKSIKTAVGGGSDLYVKYVLMSRGEDVFFGKAQDYEEKVIVKELPTLPRRVSLGISSLKRHSSNPLFRHKVTSFLFNVLVKREALSRGFFDCISLNENEYLTECSSSNLILLKNDVFKTPARESGLLWGTTLEFLRRRGVSIKEEFISLKELERADSVFICNSLIGIVPVVAVENRKLSVDEEALDYLRDKLSEG
jgi:4-amino-4-deoxychorismate lyase